MNQDSTFLHAATCLGGGSGFILWFTEMTPIFASIAALTGAISGIISLYRNAKISQKKYKRRKQLRNGSTNQGLQVQ